MNTLKQYNDTPLATHITAIKQQNNETEQECQLSQKDGRSVDPVDFKGKLLMKVSNSYLIPRQRRINSRQSLRYKQFGQTALMANALDSITIRSTA